MSKFKFRPHALFHWLNSWLHPSWLVYVSFCGFISGLSLCLAFHNFWQTSSLWLIVAILMILVGIIISRRWLIPLALLAGALLGNFRIAPELSSST